MATLPKQVLAHSLFCMTIMLGMPTSAWSVGPQEPPVAAAPQDLAAVQTTEPSTVMTRIQEIKDRAASLVSHAVDFIGTRYQRGGNTAEQGLDCSGLVRLVFKDTLNVDLPRTAADISKAGEKIDPSELQPGDLVFYNTLKRGFSHVGIYLGDNKFIHSPSKGGQVRIESMEVAYWKKRFNGARRINDDGPGN